MSDSIIGKNGGKFELSILVSNMNKYIQDKTPINEIDLIRLKIYDFSFQQWRDIITPRLKLEIEEDNKYWKKFLFCKVVGLI